MKTINATITNNNVNTGLPAAVSTEQNSNSKLLINNINWNGKTKGMRPMSSLTKTRSMMPFKTTAQFVKK